MSLALQFGRYSLSASPSRPLIMGILNVTPDSFSDGGLHATVDAAVASAIRLKEEGADLLDIGGESTRPGAEPVSPQEELRRVLPVLQELQTLRIPLSLDSRRPEVVSAAIQVGIDLVNDVSGFRTSGMSALLPLIAAEKIGICIMHMQGEPQSMQQSPQYDDVVEEVSAFLRKQADFALSFGLQPQQILLDPGFGFGKRSEHHLALLKSLRLIAENTSLPLLVGVSRKRWMAELAGIPLAHPPAQRLVPSLVVALEAARAGASVLRVHDVKATVEMLETARAIGLLPENVNCLR